MKSLAILLAMFIVDFLLWINAGFWGFEKENYISKKVLEISMPFDVKIDVEFLRSLEPANESSRTSPEGI